MLIRKQHYDYKEKTKKELMSTEERGPIGQIKPSGWHKVKYNGIIDGN